MADPENELKYYEMHTDVEVKGSFIAKWQAGDVLAAALTAAGLPAEEAKVLGRQLITISWLLNGVEDIAPGWLRLEVEKKQSHPELAAYTEPVQAVLDDWWATVFPEGAEDPLPVEDEHPEEKE